MNMAEYNNLLKEIRQRIVDGKYILPSRPDLDLNQLIFWDRLADFFMNECNEVVCDSNCDLCRERLNYESEYMINQIDKYLAGELINISPTLVLGYQSTDKSYGVGVFVYTSTNHFKAWSADKDIQTNVQRYLDELPLSSDLHNITEVPIENFELVDIQQGMLYEKELQSELLFRKITDNE